MSSYTSEFLVVKTQEKVMTLTSLGWGRGYHHGGNLGHEGEGPQSSFSTWNCGHIHVQSLYLKEEKSQKMRILIKIILTFLQIIN